MKVSSKNCVIEQVSMHLRNKLVTSRLSRWRNKSDCDGMRGQASEGQVGGIIE